MIAVGSFIGLLVAALVYFGSRAVLYQCGEPRRGVAAALATAKLATLPALVGVVTGDLRIASLVVAGLELLVVAALWRRGPSFEAARPPAARIGWGGLAAAGVIFGLIAATALRGHYFDELWLHYSLIESAARGIFPVEHPLFPGEPFGYHWGFDLLAAQVRVFTDVTTELAVDLVKLWIAGLWLWMSALVGARLAGRTGARLAVVLVPLGSSATAYFLFQGMGQLSLQWPAPLPGGWFATLVPPVITNFFQHPQGTGMPLAMAALLLLDGSDRAEAGRVRRLAVAAWLTGMLAAIQIALFGLVGLAAGAVVLAHAVRRRAIPGLVRDTLILGAALPIGASFGGILTAMGRATKNQLVAGSFFDDPLGLRVLHHLFVFGVPLLVLPWFAARTARRRDPLRIALLMAIVAGFAIPNVVVYSGSWDIVKFFMLGALFANIACVDVVASWLRKPTFARRLAAGLVTVSCVLTGSVWLLRTTVFDGRMGIHRWRESGVPPIARAVARDLLPRLGRRDYVLSTNVDLSKAGIPTPGFIPEQVGGAAYLIDHPRANRLAAHRNRARRDLDDASLQALGIRWVVFSPMDERSLSRAGKARLAGPRFERVFEAEAGGQVRRIYRYLGPNPG